MKELDEPIYEEHVPTVYVNAINPKTPLNRVEKLALTSAVIHKHPLRHFREVWKEIDPETKEEKIVERNDLHKYYNDVIRRVQKTGYTEEDIKKLGHNNYISFFKGMAEGGKDERDQNRRW